MNKSLFALFACGALLASCGKSAAPATSAGGAALAYVRLVNGSPDIETINPALPPASAACNFGSTIAGLGTLISAQIDGAPAAQSFPFQAVSQYVGVPAGAANITIVYPGGQQTGCPPLTFTTPALQAGTHLTVVVAGEYQNKNLQFAVFSDPAPSSSPGAQFENAAPLSGTVGIGTFAPGGSTYQSAGTLAFGKTASVRVANAAPGTAFFSGSASAPSSLLYPSQIDAFDTNDVLPFGSYNHLSVFIVDPPLGGTEPGLAGAFY